MFEKTLIYVSVESYNQSNTIIWHPVQAVHEHKNCYRVLESSVDPEHEYWQFSFNEIVKCDEHEFAKNEFGLIAVEKCNHKIKS